MGFAFARTQDSCSTTTGEVLAKNVERNQGHHKQPWSPHSPSPLTHSLLSQIKHKFLHLTDIPKSLQKHTQGMGREYNQKKAPHSAAPHSLGLIHIIVNLGKQGYETLERGQEDIERKARCERKQKQKKRTRMREGETQTLRIVVHTYNPITESKERAL